MVIVRGDVPEQDIQGPEQKIHMPHSYISVVNYSDDISGVRFLVAR